jgi:hypothetical protein
MGRIETMTLRTLAAIAFGLLAPARAFSDCPQSCIDIASPSCTTIAVRSASVPAGHGFGAGSGQYNLPAGTLEAGGNGTGGIGGGAAVDARDRYQVTGIPAGTPLTFTAQLDVSGFSGQSGFFFAEIIEGASNQQSWSHSNPGQLMYGVSTTIAVTINRLAGEEFDLKSTVRAGTGPVGSATTSAVLHFANLPQGARVVSCQGYAQDVPVPALPASWGSLKAQYR